MSELTLEQRKENLSRLPWVRRLKDRKRQCEGIKWSQMSMKALDEARAEAWKRQSGKLAPFVPARTRCKLKAAWQLITTADPRSNETGYAIAGYYCSFHISQQIHTEPEMRRIEEYVKRYPEKFILSQEG